MSFQKILWLDDQFEQLETYRGQFFNKGFVVDMVGSVTEAIEKLRQNDFVAVILDIKVLPGKDTEWKNLDIKIRQENPNFDSYLGFELLKSLSKPELAQVKLSPPIKLDPRRVIVLSVVNDKVSEILALGIPNAQIKRKSDNDLNSLCDLIQPFPKKR